MPVPRLDGMANGNPTAHLETSEGSGFMDHELALSRGRKIQHLKILDFHRRKKGKICFFFLVGGKGIGHKG